MSLESFVAPDSNEGMSEAAFEAFKEKVKKAAAQMAAAKKKEKKIKKKEDDLAAILVKFIKTSDKKELVLLISRALEQEVPANFVLALILLGNSHVHQSESKIKVTNEEELTFFNQGTKLPLEAKLQLDEWVKNILVSLEEKTKKIVKNSQLQNDEEAPTIKPELTKLVHYTTREFLNKANVEPQAINYKKLTNFVLKISMDHAKEIISTHLS